jgi:hypothetical protein
MGPKPENAYGWRESTLEDRKSEPHDKGKSISVRVDRAMGYIKVTAQLNRRAALTL